MITVLKTVGRNSPVGSNPTASAINYIGKTMTKLNTYHVTVYALAEVRQTQVITAASEEAAKIVAEMETGNYVWEYVEVIDSEIQVGEPVLQNADG